MTNQLTLDTCERCVVIACKRDAETTRELLMHLHRAEVPVCWCHFKFGDADAPRWLEKERGDEEPYDTEQLD